jgi:NAD(P)-dependent dehydrogenase (short-subunit alcohol dehydrogenase family)
MPDKLQFTDEELDQLTASLRELAAKPETFLDRDSPQRALFSALRAELNRCVASIQKSAVRQRKVFTEASLPTAKQARSRASHAHERACYMCNLPIQRPWPENRAMCWICGSTNEHYRTVRTSLFGQHAIVTGGRTGVGFEVVKRLLDFGATVHVTTRFPYDAARRLSDAVGGSAAPSRLRIYGLDFRDLAAVRRFVERIQSQFEPTILINNAAQTVRRPTGFYRALAEREYRGYLPPGEGDAYVVDVDLHQSSDPGAALIDEKIEASKLSRHPKPKSLVARVAQLFHATPQRATQLSKISTSALLSQLPLLPGDVDDEQWLVADVETHEADRRESNSWTQTIEDVDPVELIEVQCVNTIAPFLLTQGLFAGVSGTREKPKSVVNLAAAEGSFHLSHRRGTHPHTNMAKAALNMLTRTIAHTFAQRHIYVNSVDPGWVSDQRPYNEAVAAMTRGGVVPPLDYRDGAARVIHPIVLATSDSLHAFHGKLLRNYRVASW